jgi:hypothetical protein
LRINHLTLTRSRNAIESSTDECPFEAPPCWVDLLMSSFVLSQIDSLEQTCRWGKGAHKSRNVGPRVREERGHIDDPPMHEVRRAQVIVEACPVRIVSAPMSPFNARRTDSRGTSTACVAYSSGRMPEERVFKSLGW